VKTAALATVGAVVVVTALAPSPATFAQVAAPPTSGLTLVPGSAWKSLKERLSDKASDEQRVDNCGVPLERRGSKPRPGCPGEAESPLPASGDGKMDGVRSD
jgi:hypothetical protein